jgi:hypothetical protein
MHQFKSRIFTGIQSDGRLLATWPTIGYLSDYWDYWRPYNSVTWSHKLLCDSSLMILYHTELHGFYTRLFRFHTNLCDIHTGFVVNNEHRILWMHLSSETIFKYCGQLYIKGLNVNNVSKPCQNIWNLNFDDMDETKVIISIMLETTAYDNLKPNNDSYLRGMPRIYKICFNYWELFI